MTNGHDDHKVENGFTLKYDDDAKRDVMTIQIPLEGIALDDPIKGMVSLLGWFEFCKNEAAAIVRMKKAAMQKRDTIIRPDMSGAGLKVH